MSDKKRATGYYWIKYDVNTDWETAAYSSELDSWMLTGSELHSVDGEFHEIDESQIIRQEPKEEIKKVPFFVPDEYVIDKKIYEPIKIDYKPVQDLTKPMGHDMNPLQRNFMDSTH